MGRAKGAAAFLEIAKELANVITLHTSEDNDAATDAATPVFCKGSQSIFAAVGLAMPDIVRAQDKAPINPDKKCRQAISEIELNKKLAQNGYTSSRRRNRIQGSRNKWETGYRYWRNRRWVDTKSATDVAHMRSHLAELELEASEHDRVFRAMGSFLANLKGHPGPGQHKPSHAVADSSSNSVDSQTHRPHPATVSTASSLNLLPLPRVQPAALQVYTSVTSIQIPRPPFQVHSSELSSKAASQPAKRYWHSSLPTLPPHGDAMPVVHQPLHSLAGTAAPFKLEPSELPLSMPPTGFQPEWSELGVSSRAAASPTPSRAAESWSESSLAGSSFEERPFQLGSAGGQPAEDWPPAAYAATSHGCAGSLTAGSPLNHRKDVWGLGGWESSWGAASPTRLHLEVGSEPESPVVTAANLGTVPPRPPNSAESHHAVSPGLRLSSTLGAAGPGPEPSFSLDGDF